MKILDFSFVHKFCYASFCVLQSCLQLQYFLGGKIAHSEGGWGFWNQAAFLCTLAWLFIGSNSLSEGYLMSAYLTCPTKKKKNGGNSSSSLTLLLQVLNVQAKHLARVLNLQILARPRLTALSEAEKEHNLLSLSPRVFDFSYSLNFVELRLSISLCSSQCFLMIFFV